VTLHHQSHADLAAQLRAEGRQVDSLIVDAPYSERTHQGHDDGTASANRVADWARGKLARGETHAGGCDVAVKAARAARLGAARRELHYAAWSPADVWGFVETWAPLTRGWMVSITDSELAPVWTEAMEAQDRLVFSPLACVVPGSRVRMMGDGPAQWSVWAVVSRPRDGEWLQGWRDARRRLGAPCSLPGAYVVPPGQGGVNASVGGKPLWLMRALVRDYSLPGELVCDPCCGAGTTLKAAEMEGRRWLGADISDAQLDLARAATRAVQQPLFGGV